jgi:sec-independent protein translocase protein TatB
MFDISFSEMLVILVIALVVLGPERLPKVARTVGRWSGQARGYLRNLTQELDRESKLADLKRQIEEAQREVKKQASDFETSTRSYASEVSRTFKPDHPEYDPDFDREDEAAPTAAPSTAPAATPAPDAERKPS